MMRVFSHIPVWLSAAALLSMTYSCSKTEVTGQQAGIAFSTAVETKVPVEQSGPTAAMTPPRFRKWR